MTTNLRSKYIQLFLVLLVQHNQVYLLQKMLIFYFFCDILLNFINRMVFYLFNFYVKLILLIFSSNYRLVFWVGFRCVYIIRNLIVLYAQLHQVGRYLVLNHDEYISFYERNLMPWVLKQYRIVLINEWKYLFSLKDSSSHLLVNIPWLNRDYLCLGRNISSWQSMDFFPIRQVHFFIIWIE